MKYALILAILSGGGDDEAVILAAGELARREGAQVRVIPPAPLGEAVVWADAFGSTYLAGAAVAQLAEAQERILHDIEALSQRAAQRLGLAYGDPAAAGILVVSDPGPAWLTLEAEAPLADLVVVGARTSRSEGFWGSLSGDALMRIRKPVLLVRAPETVAGGVVAIAWDGSLPAGQAVRSALPLLKAASRVVILQDPEGMTPGERKAGDPQRLAAYLSLQGIGAVEIRKAAGRREGQALSAAASQAGANVIVAGGFGHSRLGELLLGGATRTLVMAEEGPHLLLAH